MNVKAKGYVLGVIAAATYGMNPLFALPLYEAGMNPDSVLFFRYLFAIPVLGAMIKLRGRDFKLKRKEILPLSSSDTQLDSSSVKCSIELTALMTSAETAAHTMSFPGSAYSACPDISNPVYSCLLVL